jgi:hypothetical protein
MMRVFIVNFMVLVILVSYSSANHEHENETDGEQFVVRPLNAKNYHTILDSHKFVFVKFFVKWCKYW